MHTGKFLGASLLVLALAAPLGAEARDLPAGGLTRDQVATWLRSKGYSATVEHDNTAQDDYILSKSNDVSWGIYFYACKTTGACTSIQYSAGWDDATNVTDDELNIWNRDKRFIRAYHNTGGSVFGEYDIDIAPGGTWEQLDYTLDRWNSQLKNFKTFVEEH